MRFCYRLITGAGVLLLLCHVSLARSNRQAAAPVAKAAVSSKQLEKLTQELKQKNSAAAYSQLSAIATQKSSGIVGMRAALALGYFDYMKGRYAEATKWLDRAQHDPLLAEYARYWSAEVDLAQNRDAQALYELKAFRKDVPDSVITDQVLQALGEAALASKQPSEAIAALNSYSLTPARPALLFLRAEAYEQANQPLDAAANYQAVYTRFAVSEQARQAATRLDFLRGSMGDKFPALPLAQQFAHAAVLYNAKDWRDARNEYAAILTQLSGADHDRAAFRILECGVKLGAALSEISALQINDPDVQAERSYAVADYDRSKQLEAEMVQAVEAAVSQAPSSPWAAQSLFLAGNYYWVQLDRDRASGFYKRLEEQFPTVADATAAQWRVSWTAVLKRAPEAAELLEEHLRRFPGSLYTPDALYWLGRLAEDAGVPGLARSYYEKILERYPQNYFEGLALAHVRGLKPGPTAATDVLATIPPAPVPPKLSASLAPAAMQRKIKADALRSISFDASAELELRAGYAETGEPRLLLEAAQAAVDAGHWGAAIVTIRQIYPQLEAQPLLQVPRAVWQVAYGLPFQQSIRRWSTKTGIDPMLVAGLIHQESAFEPEARSGANAVGLMQLLPQTARRLAKQAKIGYSVSRLVDPDYNVRLGTIYVAGLQKQFGNVESALAAYNAGEDRVVSWTAGQSYREPAEFVDSIPFTETRQYVEIVSRNADIYRRLYGVENGPRGDSRKTRAHVGN